MRTKEPNIWIEVDTEAKLFPELINAIDDVTRSVDIVIGAAIALAMFAFLCGFNA